MSILKNKVSERANMTLSRLKVTYSKDFVRDLTALAKRYPEVLISSKYITAMDCLLNRKPLPASYVNHPLSGDWKGYWDCHIQGDLVLIYRYVGDFELRLARLNTHSQLAL